MTPDPWQDIAANFPVGSKHSVLVKKISLILVFLLNW